MKWLRNPWVTGALAVVAVLVVFYQVLGPQMLPRGPAPASPAPAAASAPAPANPAPGATPLPGSAPAVASAKPAGPVELPEPVMDRGYLESHFAAWVNAPRRDPFLLAVPAPVQKQVVRGNSPVESWKLSGIWNQAGSRLAVINKRVYGEGDEIQGFRIQKIAGDEVWFSGTNGLERLGLQRHPSATGGASANPPREK